MLVGAGGVRLVRNLGRCGKVFVMRRGQIFAAGLGCQHTRVDDARRQREQPRQQHLSGDAAKSAVLAEQGSHRAVVCVDMR